MYRREQVAFLLISLQLVCSRVEFHFSKEDLESLDGGEEVDIVEWEKKFQSAKQGMGMYFV